MQDHDRHVFFKMGDMLQMAGELSTNNSALSVMFCLLDWSSTSGQKSLNQTLNIEHVSDIYN
jgi:hypothetical protein